MRIMYNPKTRTRFISPSEQFINYQNDCLHFLNRYSYLNLDEQLNVQCHFYMSDKRRVDLTNLLESIDDILVHYHVLKDDSSNIIVSHDGSRVFYDKNNPRTEIEITSIN